MAKIKKNSHKILYRKYSSNLKYVMMVVCVLVITFYLPKQPRFRYEFEKGKTWLNKDLVSPFSFAVLKTPQQIEADKKTAVENTLPIYQYVEDVFKEQGEAYLNEFDVKWKSNTLNENEKETNKQRSYQLLNTIYNKGIIDVNPKHQTKGKYYDFSLVKNNVSTKSNSQDLFTVETALVYLKDHLNISNEAIKKTIIELAESHVKPNVLFDDALTTTVQANAINSISTTKGMVQKGELIVANETVIDEEVYQKLVSFRETYDAQTKSVGDDKLVFLGQVLLVGFITGLLMVFLFLFRKDI